MGTAVVTTTIVREVTPGVYVFGVSPDAVRALKTSIYAYREANAGRTYAPNSMNKYGLILSGGKMRDTVQELQWIYIEDLAADYYDLKLKVNPYAFLVDYEMNKQRSLAAHFDSSDVTMNLCLEQKSFGGELVFYDRAGKKPVCEIKHRVGQAIIHRGSHVHRAKPITEGRRTNLILWCQAKKRRL